MLTEQRHTDEEDEDDRHVGFREIRSEITSLKKENNFFAFAPEQETKVISCRCES